MLAFERDTQKILDNVPAEEWFSIDDIRSYLHVGWSGSNLAALLDDLVDQNRMICRWDHMSNQMVYMIKSE